jgi:hypothetical protein
MNVEIGAEAAQFPEKEYTNGIAFAVRDQVVGGKRGGYYVPTRTLAHDLKGTGSQDHLPQPNRQTDPGNI